MFRMLNAAVPSSAPVKKLSSYLWWCRNCLAGERFEQLLFVHINNAVLIWIELLLFGPMWSPRASSDTVSCSFSYHTWQSSSSPSSLSPLASSLTRSVFHSELKLGSSANPFLHRPFPFLQDWFNRPSNVSILLNGWICLHDGLD